MSQSFELESTQESELQQKTQIEARKLGAHLLRNNSGAFEAPGGRWVRFGLGNISKKFWSQWRSGDLIGPTEIIITPEMVGKKIGVFTMVECKEPNWTFKGTEREVAQKNAIDWVIARGGFAGFANSLESLKKIIGQ